MLLSAFGAASVIADMNGDRIMDVVKQTSLNPPQHVAVTYKDGHVRSYVNGRLVHDAALNGTLTAAVDPLAGALVALLILRTGIFILRESSMQLMDAVPSRKLAKQVLGLLKDVNGVRQLEEIQAHRFGPSIVINLTIGIEGNLTVIQGDQIATRVENMIYDSIPNVMHVHIHYHPADKQHENMTIDEILTEARQHLSPRQTEYYD